MSNFKLIEYKEGLNTNQGSKLDLPKIFLNYQDALEAKIS